MNVGELKEFLKAVSDDTIILTSDYDHNYRNVSIHISTVLEVKKDRIWCEDFGEDQTPEEEYGKRIVAVIVE